MRLPPFLAAEGVRLRALGTVGSTNAEALGLAHAGERGPLWVTAQAQQAGRGRRGRAWASEAGNLYASLLLTDVAPPAMAPQLSFVCALAVHDALAQAAPALAPRTKLKWPNDVLVGGRKVAGILIEGEFLAAEKLAVAAGMGINTAHHPAGIAATDCAAEGAQVAPEALFASLAQAMHARLRQWARGQGFAAVRAAWLARAGGVGTVIKVRGQGGDIEGTFETIDGGGQLVLREAGGAVRLVAAGDVAIPGLTADAGP
jgi:BirA family biotin operon repressor/biotin-[acetyl-CoA-carboxylase] ligase